MPCTPSAPASDNVTASLEASHTIMLQECTLLTWPPVGLRPLALAADWLCKGVTIAVGSPLCAYMGGDWLDADVMGDLHVRAHPDSSATTRDQLSTAAMGTIEIAHEVISNMASVSDAMTDMPRWAGMPDAQLHGEKCRCSD